MRPSNSLAVLALLLAGCSGPATSPSSTGQPSSTNVQPPAGESVSPVVVVADGPVEFIRFAGQSNTCIPVSQLDRDWTFTVPAERPRAVRLKVVQIYSKVSGCDNIRPDTDGGVGKLTNLSPVSGDGSFPVGVAGVALYRLDSGLKCGAFEVESWDLETGASLPHLHVYAPADCPPDPPVVVAPPPPPPVVPTPQVEPPPVAPPPPPPPPVAPPPPVTPPPPVVPPPPPVVPPPPPVIPPPPPPPVVPERCEKHKRINCWEKSCRKHGKK